MARNMRKGYEGAFKAKMALEALKGEKTLVRLSSEFGVHANQMRQWKAVKPAAGVRPWSLNDSGKNSDCRILFCDNYLGINRFRVKAILAKMPGKKLRAEFLPPDSPELNPVERVQNKGL